jgi:hypothetical protein
MMSTDDIELGERATRGALYENLAPLTDGLRPHCGVGAIKARAIAADRRRLKTIPPTPPEAERTKIMKAWVEAGRQPAKLVHLRDVAP